MPRQKTRARIHRQLATFEMCLQGGVFDKADGGGDGGAGGVGAGAGQLTIVKMCLQGGVFDKADAEIIFVSNCKIACHMLNMLKC